jgi:hypothetical protein
MQRLSEIEKLKGDNATLVHRLETAEEIRAKLEVEVLQQAEEIDIAKYYYYINECVVCCWCDKITISYSI